MNLKENNLLSKEDVRLLYDRAQKEKKTLLLHVVWERSPTDHTERDNVLGIVVDDSLRVNYIAGICELPFFMHYRKNGPEWKLSQASRSDLLLYLDHVIDSEVFTQIVDYNTLNFSFYILFKFFTSVPVHK